MMLSRTRRRVLLLLFLASALSLLVVAEPCTFCKYGDATSPDTLIQREKSFDLTGLADNCGELYDLSSSDELDEIECGLVQSISTICGCPAREEACSLCSVGASLGQKALSTQVTLPNDIAVAATIFGVDTVSCELIQAYGQSRVEGRTGCQDLQAEFGEACGCPVEMEQPPNATAVDGGAPDIGSADEEQFCGFCRKNAHTLVPERDLSQLVHSMSQEERESWEEYANNQTDNLLLTCGSLDSFMNQLPRGHLVCSAPWSKIAQGVCRCPPRDTYCDICRNTKYPDLSMTSVVAQLSSATANLELTCADVHTVANQYRPGGLTCLGLEHFQFLCGCDTGREYLGASTTVQKAWLAWLPRFSALLSLVGSSMILIDVARDKQKRTQVYPQLMAVMSIFDCSSSLAWALSTAPLPSTEFGLDTELYGAVGTSATCVAQGFFLQLGLTGMLYSLSLCIYYAMVIVYNVRDSQMKRLLFHGPPIVVGLGLALAGIPHYTYLFAICHIPPPPLVEDKTLVNVFSIVPICTAMVGCTCCLLFIYYHAWNQDRAANRWRIQERTSSAEPTLSSSESNTQHRKSRNRLSTAVIWQATLYMTSFLLTWPIYFWGVYRYTDLYNNYVFWVLLVCLNPLQGFWNSLVYFRVRIAEWLEKRRSGLKRLWSASTENSAIRRSQTAESANGGVSAGQEPALIANIPTLALNDQPQPPKAASEQPIDNRNETKNDRAETEEKGES